MKRGLCLIVILGAAFTVSACTASTPGAGSLSADATPSIAALPLPSASAPASVHPTPDAAASQNAATPNASAAVFLPVDSGPQPAANGTVTLDPAGNPLAYTVAEGDAVSAVADRFGIFVYGLVQPDGSRVTYDKTLIVTGETLTFKTYLPSCRSVPDPNACD